MGIINTIKDLRSLWIKGSNNEEENINKMIRIISLKFLREEAIAYFSKKMIKIKIKLKIYLNTENYILF